MDSGGPHVKNPKIYAVAGSALMLGSLAFAGTSSTYAAAPASNQLAAMEVRGQLNPLNNSGVRGFAEIDVWSAKVDVDVDARGLLANNPHAQHIHFGAKARNECPTVADDANGDFRLTTTDGAPAYGPIKKSLTTRGDASPASALAIKRFPMATKGTVNYDRSIRVSDKLARAIENGRGVIVLHGVDYNDNGKYDFRSAGKSELDPAFPAEATDPAACGVLK
jgi:hypothetical protein